MNFTKTLPKVLLSIVLSTVGTGAHAIALTDVTFNGDNADDLLLVEDKNDSLADINALTTRNFAGNNWTSLHKADDSSNTPVTIEGVTFTLSTSDLGATNGFFELSWSAAAPSDLPLMMDFIFVNKAGSLNWGAYLFEDEVFTSDPLTGTGTFNIGFLNKAGNTAGLSHISIYGRAVNDPDITVPEPGSLSLFGLGALLLGFTRRRVAS